MSPLERLLRADVALWSRTQSDAVETAGRATLGHDLGVLGRGAAHRLEVRQRQRHEVWLFTSASVAGVHSNLQVGTLVNTATVTADRGVGHVSATDVAWVTGRPGNLSQSEATWPSPPPG